MLDGYLGLRGLDRWKAGLCGSGGLSGVPGWMGSSPGEAWAEGTLSGLLPPDTSLLAWDFFGGRCSAGAVLDSPVLWLLDTTGTAPPGLGGRVRGCSGEGRAMRGWLLVSRPITLRWARGLRRRPG